MRVLITGASGLIGGRLARHLGAVGHEVVLASRNRLSVSLSAGFPIVAIDLEDVRTLDMACKGMDAVVHAAGMNAAECEHDPKAAFVVNATGTGRVATSARRCGVSKFIYLSTVHVYASPLVGSITEETETNNPHSYATSHRAGEVNALDAGDSGMQVTVLRLSNSFGAPIHPAVNCWMLLANDLCRRWAETNALRLTSSGLQERDFATLTAVCLTIERLLNADGRSNIYNLGGCSMSVLDLAGLIQSRAEQFGSRPALTHNSGRPDEGGELHYSTSRLRKVVGEVPQDYEAEIDELLLFCKRHFRSQL